jgi:uncharacterized protein YcfJ
MKRIHTTALAIALGIAAAGPALAWQQGYHSYGPIYDYARVTRVERVVERSRYPVNNEVCYDQPVSRYRPGYTYYHRDTTGPTVLGALVGGALGNQVGKGDGRRAATIAGAVIGGSVAHESAERRRGDYGYESGYYETGYEQRCRTETNWRGRDNFVAFNVSYRYDGRTYRTTLDHDPGRSLRVRVGNGGVTPAE